MRIVVDTNVLVSALMNSNSIPANILSSILTNELTILYDNRILHEYIDVLSRKEFGFSSDIINALIGHIDKNGEYIAAGSSGTNFTDESDKKFYEVFKSASALYLITGNVKHFPKETGIVTPREFVDRLKT